MARQANDKNWNDFVQWCRKRHLRPMPAHPWTIAAFLRWMDSCNRGDSADSALKSISRAHLLSGRRSPHRHPMIERTLGSIYRRRESAADRSNLFEARDILAPAEKTIPLPTQPRDDDGPSLPRRQSMRNQPRLVSRRRRFGAA